ncbi:MAG: hypothetical protein JRH20_24195 [Deltaproteobacteria bacterium]|nr:hypothetical protein [Deltaproteobacteria bacterium]
MRSIVLFALSLALFGCRQVASYEQASAIDLVTGHDLDLGSSGEDGDLPDGSVVDPKLLRDWRPGPDLPQARHWGKMAYLASEGALYFFGGIDSAGQTRNELWRFDGRVWKEVCVGCNAPHRMGHAFVATETKLLLYGGIDDEGSEPADQSVWSYTPGENHWVEHPGSNAPPPRYRVLAAPSSFLEA